MKKIVLAGGCFWGVEEFMSRVDGVIMTTVGYANGQTQNPTYEEVCTDATGHAEACLVQYDESKITLEQLLDKFWLIIDPTVKDRQGNDRGTQYRTGIFYTDPEDLAVILKSKSNEQSKYDKPIVTEVVPLKCFYPAEEYHQKYLKKNPGGYCHIDPSKMGQA